MGNRLKEIFNNEPPSEEELLRLENIRKEAAKNKHCVACKHYSYDAYVSGITTYEGDCDLGFVAMFGKQEKPCKRWEIRDGYV